MAKGRTHTTVNNYVVVLVIIALIVAFFLGVTFQWLLLALFLLGLGFGYIHSPDLDLETITISERQMAQGFSWTLSWLSDNKEYKRKVMNFFIMIFKIIWMPYAFFLPHRSAGSHLPVFSDVIRITYAAFAYGTIIVLLIIGVHNLTGWGMDITWWMSMKEIFWFLFTDEYMSWLSKIAFVAGSSIMTLSHLTLDSFKIRW
jgi:uncharacterized metal-binding protein